MAKKVILCLLVIMLAACATPHPATPTPSPLTPARILCLNGGVVVLDIQVEDAFYDSLRAVYVITLDGRRSDFLYPADARCEFFVIGEEQP